MIVLPVMITVTPHELETIGTMTVWNTGTERDGKSVYSVTWSSPDDGETRLEVLHDPADGILPLVAKATEQFGEAWIESEED